MLSCAHRPGARYRTGGAGRRGRLAGAPYSVAMLLRSVILAAARNDGLKHLVTTAPVSRTVVRRYVAGEGVEDAIRVTRELADQGLAVSLDHLGEDTTEPEHAAATTKASAEKVVEAPGSGAEPVAAKATPAKKTTPAARKASPAQATSARVTRARTAKPANPTAVPAKKN